MGRADFRAFHADRVIVARFDVGGDEWPCEARPAGARFVFIERTKKDFSGNDVHVNPGFVIIPVQVIKRSFGGGLLGDLILQRREAAFEFTVGWLCPRSCGYGSGLGVHGFWQQCNYRDDG